MLLDHDVTRFSTGTVALNTQGDSTGPNNYFADPNVAGGTDLLNLQHIFSPEEAGNLGSQMNKNTMNSIRSTIGVQGDIGASDWRYLADMTYSENKLTEATHLAFTQAVNAFYAPIFAPILDLIQTSGSPSMPSTTAPSTSRSPLHSMRVLRGMRTPTPTPRRA